jgi:5-methylcytosine-specific restriction endonuclease McrA
MLEKAGPGAHLVDLLGVSKMPVRSLLYVRFVSVDGKTKTTVLVRDAYTCQACGAKPAGQVHHIQPRSQGGADDLANLITLCGRCHMVISPVPPHALRRAFNMSLKNIKEEQVRVHQAIRRWQQDRTL